MAGRGGSAGAAGWGGRVGGGPGGGGRLGNISVPGIIRLTSYPKNFPIGECLRLSRRIRLMRKIVATGVARILRDGRIFRVNSGKWDKGGA